MAKPIYYYGIHAVERLIEKRPEDALQLFLLDKREDVRLQHIKQLAADFGISTQSAKKDKLEKLANSHQHQGVVVQARPIKLYNEHDLIDFCQSNHNEPKLFLVLDQITDPHNLGACMRTAAAMGVTAVISSKDRACSLTATAVKVAAGAAEITPFVSVTNLVRALKLMQENHVFVVGTMLDDKAINLQQCDLKQDTAIVMGAEDTGLRQLTQKTCDQLCYLPMYGNIQSLNVSVATGMALYEVKRQQNH